VTILDIVLASTSVLSALGTGGAVLGFRSRWRVDEHTARKLRNEIEKEDEARNRARIEADLARADGLRKELTELTMRNNQQFDEIVDTRQEVLELRQEVFELRQWAQQVTALPPGSPLPPVPSMRAQPRRFRTGNGLGPVG
jgi:hypothetical protein